MNEPKLTETVPSPTAAPVEKPLSPEGEKSPTAEAAAPVAAPPSGAPAAPAAPPTDSKKPAQGGRPQRGGSKENFHRPKLMMKEPVPYMEVQKSSAPSLRELDEEIAGELEAALGGMSPKALQDAEEASNANQLASAPAGSEGRKLGKVLSVHGPDVFVEVPGGRSQGVLSMIQFPDGPPAPGTTVDINIEGYDRANGLLILSRRGAAVVADWSTVAEGMTVEARVTEVNKGGLAVEINGLRGFMPMGQIDIYRVEQPEQFINQRLLCLVTEVNPEERNLVVSRRALLEKGREEVREKLWTELAEGQIRTGIIRSVREFGAFVDIGGVDGLLHVGDLSWKRVKDPSEVVEIGQSVRVVVLKVDREKRKIGLGLKQLESSPWDNIEEKYHSGQIVQGTVTRTMDFGAFVELEPGVEGLVHISELAGRRVFRVTDIVKPEQQVEAKILSIDPEAKRMSLSLKAMIQVAAPVEEEEEEEEEAVESKPPPPRKTPLRGGIGSSAMAFEPVPEEEGK